MYFNQEIFSKNYQASVNELDHVTEIVDSLKGRQYQKIFFVGCGGTFTKFVNLKALMFAKLKVPFMIVTPAELLETYQSQVTARTLVVVGTKTGETSEILHLVEVLKQKIPNCSLIAFIGDDHSTLEQSQLIDARIHSIDTDANLLAVGWFLLNLAGSDAAQLVRQKQQIIGAKAPIIAGIKQLLPYSLKQVNQTDLSAMQMWVGSGNLWGEVCCFTNYMLEEIQRIKAQAINAGEFFHGPFEIVDQNQNVNVVINSGANRQEDLRVLNFVKNLVAEPLVIDLQNFALQDLDPDIRAFVEPYALNHYFDTLYNMYSVKTGRTAQTRRYYRLLDY
ncbi:SIS domain-containing protein [Bombilactobacillus folatiphilus]|uniref:SIS domain-containing protein n=1 Tax=Bombilactobacillus folatiphilus TaxID=2923362 RepID=A0ABY4PAA1_9LACO|nr:SIS domain-containing protein [Bombilactobacillus folatiphilus]UQS82479.1 SIS domain-containing protein [Bombilactobacillus folatiphilus]